LNQAAAVHCTTELERRHVESYGVSGPTVVVPLPVDVEQLEAPDPELFLEAWPQLRDRRVVTFIGRLTPKKRLDLLIEGFAKARGSFSDASLVIAGPDEGMHLDLLRQAIGLGIGDAVHFVGYVGGRLKASLLAASMVFALPSEDENFGHAAVEAMASGVPVILSSRVGIEDVVAATGSGTIVGLSADEVGAAIRRVLADDRAARLIGAQGRHLARETFSRQAVARSLERTYETILAGGDERRTWT
jgi:glycosyltransferase involved in cell wall biosynthesis